MINNGLFGNTPLNPSISNIVDGFYRSRAIFYSYYEMHKRYEKGDEKEDVAWLEHQSLVEFHLRPLKDMSHRVLRSSADSELRLKRDLFDIIVGELFHEVEDLRAAVHQALDYKPRLERYAKEKTLTERDKSLLAIMMKYTQQAESRIPRKYEEVKKFFNEATEIFERDVLPLYKEDKGLLRSLTVVCGEKAVVERLPVIFGYMFEDGEFEAFYTAGIDCLRTLHIDLALNALNKALGLYEAKSSDREFVERNGKRIQGLTPLLLNARGDAYSSPDTLADADLMGYKGVDEMVSRIGNLLAQSKHG